MPEVEVESYGSEGGREGNEEDVGWMMASPGRDKHCTIAVLWSDVRYYKQVLWRQDDMICQYWRWRE